MAKKKTHRKRTQHRRSRVGAMGTTIETALFAIAGGVAAKAVQKILPSTLPAIVGNSAPIVLGLVVPKFVKGNAGVGIGAGMVAVGGLGLVQSFGVLNGVPVVASPYPARMRRPGTLKVAGVTPNPVNRVLAGLDADKC
jgi:hypothetical protein